MISPKRETKIFKDKEYVLEESIFGDFALIKAWKADKTGNLQFRGSARNFNQDMATAAKEVIVEVEEIVDELDPNHIHVPGVYIDKIVKCESLEKRIERRTV